MNSPSHFENSINKFALERARFEQFTSKLEVLLKDMLLVRELDFHLLDSRTKTISSFKDKITRSSKAYNDPLDEITDICGIRIITYYQNDADEIGKLINEQFLVDKEHSVVHVEQGAEFGYKSSHFIIQLKNERQELLEWESFKAIRAEIQVRTVLQHAWAAISHKLQYKNEQDVPLVLKRKLFRLSALFELADDEFVSLRDASGKIRKEISEQLSIGQKEILVDRLSVDEYIKESNTVDKLCEIAKDAGFTFENFGSESDSLSSLVEITNIANLRTVEELDRVLTDSLKWADEYLSMLFDENKSNKWYVSANFICELILLRAYIHLIKKDNLLKLGYSDGISTLILRVTNIQNIKKKVN